MKRHAHQADYYGGEMVERLDGDYVLYTDALDLQRQLAEVTRERDTLKAMVELHDAMNDRRRLAQETPHKRRQYENG